MSSHAGPSRRCLPASRLLQQTSGNPSGHRAETSITSNLQSSSGEPENHAFPTPNLGAAQPLRHCCKNVSNAAAGPGRPQTPIPPQLPPGLTKKELDRYAISSLSYLSTVHWLKALTAKDQDQPGQPLTGVTHAGDLVYPPLFRSEPYTIVYNRQLTSNAVKDVEPSTVVQQTMQGTFQATTYIEARADNDFSVMSRNVDQNGNLVAQELPFPNAAQGWVNPGAYNVTADPLMSFRMHNSGNGPRYVYTAGIAHTGASFAQCDLGGLLRQPDHPQSLHQLRRELGR